MPGETVLIVEDEPTMLRLLKDNFEGRGYRVRTAADGEAGLAAALDDGPDLVLLDIMLPKVNGYEVCRLLRREGLDVPIIMLTARGREADIVLGLELGADDYVTKPFSIQELTARVNAFLRRRRVAEPAGPVRFGEFELDLPGRRLHCNGAEVKLTPKEFRLLAFFAQNPGRSLTRNEILDAVWGRSVFVTPRSVDRCVKTLRAKLAPDAESPDYIRTLWRVGYRFDPPNGHDAQEEDL